MVAWRDYKKHAQERGSLALELFVVFSTPVKPPEAVKAVLPDHLNYLAEQESDGRLAFAGPLSDLSGDNMEGDGFLVYWAESLKEAKKLAANDPMHLTKTRTFTIRRWLLNEGFLKPEDASFLKG
ncbi:MAG: hypothetical protein GY952_00510 [Rhodobacteraceae bacterium]|nr:hypothetical protein [Paracoccaceae bacterium]